MVSEQNTTKTYMCCGYCCCKKNENKQTKNPKQPVDISESEGVLSELCYPVTGYYCVTVMVLEMGPRLVPRNQRSGVDGCRAARDPSPSDPPPFFPPFRKT